MMRSTVVKKDTGSRDILVHGTSRAESNRETIVMRSTVVKKDNAEMNMMRSTVVKRDTGSRDIVHGTSRAEINKETIVNHSTIVVKESTSSDMVVKQKRGFQHVYASTKTMSSCRVQEAYNVSVNKGYPLSKLAARRDKVKKKKIENLIAVSSSPEHSLCKSFFLTSRPVFYSGRRYRDTILPKAIGDGHMLSAIEDLKVIDTKSGARLKLESGDAVFTLIPRHYAIQKLTHVHRTVRSLYALEDSQTKAEIRGKKRIPVAEDDGKYTTIGLKANRGSKGITESWPKKLSGHDRKKITNLMTICEEVAKGYVKSNELRGLRIAQLLGEWPEIEGVSSQPIWGSLACGKNYYLNSHVDEDFFYSLTTIVSEGGLQQEIDRYDMDAEVCNYFTFPEQGIAVSLRPGDMLLFNPTYQHCLSSRTSFYDHIDVFCLSLYLKTAVVGGNDNTVR